MSSQVKTLLRQFDFKAKKRLGQHFLADEAVLKRILSGADLSPGDIIVEVGPGLGMLTKELAQRVAKVIAVELDSKLVDILKERLAPYPNIHVIHADILKIAPWQLLEDDLVHSNLSLEYKVVANLPYYITSPAINHFLEASVKPSIMVVMVQKEVGEAIAAAPGKMTQLGISVQFYSRPTIITYVPANDFYPVPKVDSVVLRLDVYSELPVKVPDVAGFFDIVHRGFSSPRKQLRNSLAYGLAMPPGEISLLLGGIGIDASRRAETLTLEEWRKIWEVFAPFRT